MERLIGGGYIDTAFMGLRPWTRMSCAKMLIEMEQRVEYHTDLPPEILRIQKVLDTEFADELAGWDGRPVQTLQLDSVYTRAMEIAGTPVNDSMHFGQTLINDYGRPYLAGLQQHHRLQRQRHDRAFRLLRRRRISVRAHDSCLSAVGAAGDLQCR